MNPVKELQSNAVPAETAKPAWLPFHLPDIGQAEIDAVTETLRSGWLTTGPKTRQFEEAFAKFIGAPHAIAVNSCTSALHLALEAVGVKEGDEVIVPTVTFAATAEVVTYFKAKPVFVDCRAVDLNMDPEKLEAAVTPRTKAIIPVHMAGHPCDMDPIMAVARRRGLRVIEDAAHALPTRYKGRLVGTISDITCFSFYATKTLTTGEGGMITTSDSDLAERMRIMSLHGISKDAWKRYTAEGSWYYEILSPGYKYNLTDPASALGLEQLKRCDEFLGKRSLYARLYTQAFMDMPELECPQDPADGQHAWHLYILKLNLDRLAIGRNAFIEELKLRGIGTSVHFIPLHMHPYYRDAYGYTPESFPVAAGVFQRIVTLPNYTKMSAEDVERVIVCVRDVVRKNRR